MSKTKRSTNVLQTRQNCYKISIGSVGWLNQLDEDQISQGRNICLTTYILLKCQGGKHSKNSIRNLFCHTFYVFYLFYVFCFRFLSNLCFLFLFSINSMFYVFVFYQFHVSCFCFLSILCFMFLFSTYKFYVFVIYKFYVFVFYQFFVSCFCFL